MNSDGEITLITCSGISNTGKLTAKTGEVLMQRCPGMIEQCISCRMESDRLQRALSQAEKIVILDGCSDWCGRKKVQDLGFDPDIHLIATENGIIKKGMEDPLFNEIEHLITVVKDKLQ